MVRHCAENLAEIDEQFKCAVAGLDVAHFDETGTRVDNKLNWVHVASNQFLTYLYLSEKRGKLGMEEGAVLSAFHGIAVHDCWASYWSYGSAHAICCAHLLRELNGILDIPLKFVQKRSYSDFSFRYSSYMKGISYLSIHAAQVLTEGSMYRGFQHLWLRTPLFSW